MKLPGKIAIITGGASGIGLATATLLAKQGATVILLDRNPQVSTIATSINGHGFSLDITDNQALSQQLENIIARFGAPSILINCAGVAPAKRMLGKEGTMPLEDFTKVIDINLIASFNMMRLLVPAMSGRTPDADEEECGVIINTASIAAFEGQIGQTAYAASKGAIVSMTLPAARELARYKIRIMTIAPGVVATPMIQAMPEAVQQSLADAIPFPKRLAAPDEFAALAQHIIENPMLNGSVIRLDGALRMA